MWSLFAPVRMIWWRSNTSHMRTLTPPVGLGTYFLNIFLLDWSERPPGKIQQATRHVCKSKQRQQRVLTADLVVTYYNACIHHLRSTKHWRTVQLQPQDVLLFQHLGLIEVGSPQTNCSTVPWKDSRRHQGRKQVQFSQNKWHLLYYHVFTVCLSAYIVYIVPIYGLVRPVGSSCKHPALRFSHQKKATKVSESVSPEG